MIARLVAFICAGIFGPDLRRSIEEAEADYQVAKERYDDAVSRKDKRGQGQALKSLNTALNHMLRVHYDAKCVSVPGGEVAA